MVTSHWIPHHCTVFLREVQQMHLDNGLQTERSAYPQQKHYFLLLCPDCKCWVFKVEQQHLRKLVFFNQTVATHGDESLCLYMGTGCHLYFDRSNFYFIFVTYRWEFWRSHHHQNHPVIYSFQYPELH